MARFPVEELLFWHFIVYDAYFLSRRGRDYGHISNPEPAVMGRHRRCTHRP